MMAHRYPHRLLILMVLIAGLLPFQTTHSQGDNQHPRLYFTTQELDTLRQQAATTHNAMWLVIKTYVDGEQDTSPKTSPPNKNLDTFRNAGNQLMVFGFACAIDDTYCPLARDYLLAYVQWEQWDIPDHRDLGHAHLLLGSALAYDWTYTHLSESERATVRTHLGDRAEQMYEASTAQDYVEEWHNWWPKSYMQNHCGTNYSGMGMAGLALKGEDDRAQKWIDRAAEQIGNIQLLQEGIGDGTWHEGIAYQSYAHTM